MDELADQYAAISLEEEESGGLSYAEEEVLDGGIDTRWCLVGNFLSDRSINFEKMQHSLATLWKPGNGVYVKCLEPNLFLFQFYHEVDIARVKVLHGLMIECSLCLSVLRKVIILGWCR